MTTLLLITHILVSLFLIAIVLLQHGKGADIGATFGGSSQSVFGSEGPVPLLNKITTFAAIVFMGTSISLAYISANKGSGTVMEDIPKQQSSVPAPVAPITIPMQTTESTEVTPQAVEDVAEEVAIPAETTEPAPVSEEVLETVPAAEEVNKAEE